MNKKLLIPMIIIGLFLVAGVIYLWVTLDNQKRENKAMQELAELDKKEMENEYQQFANQYSEMKTKINLIRELRPLGLLTTNQCLELLNLPPIEDGDDRVQTLNVANTAIVDQYQMGKLKSLNDVGRPPKDEDTDEEE